VQTALVLFAVDALPAIAQHDVLQGVLARFEARLAADVAEDGIGSIAAGVVVDGHLVWQRAFGWARTGPAQAARPDMLYRTGSISKSFTALLMMRLVEKSVLDLDDPVERHFPEVRGLIEYDTLTAPITFRQIGGHIAGLQREPDLRGAASGPIEEWTDKILASIPTTGFDRPPGTAYGYSNIGFGMLGLALERAAGRPFTEMMSEEVFGPLGMESATFVVPAGSSGQLAAGYANRRDGSVDAHQPALEHAGRGYKVPNGGIYASVDDLARFIAGMTGRSTTPLLSDRGRSEMLRRQTPIEGPAYGLGFSLRTTDEGVLLAGHGGSVAGYTAHVLFEPTTGCGVILLRNYGRGATNLGGEARTVLLEVLETINPQ